MGDEDDTNPLKKKIIDIYAKSPKESRDKLLLLLMEIVGEPTQEDRLSRWLHELLFERLAELKKVT